MLQTLRRQSLGRIGQVGAEESPEPVELMTTLAIVAVPDSTSFVCGVGQRRTVRGIEIDEAALYEKARDEDEHQSLLGRYAAGQAPESAFVRHIKSG